MTLTPIPARAADTPTPTAQLEFFEKRIRPVLAEKCYQCHSEKADKIKGGLLLDTRDGIRRGGDSGPAIVPSEPDQSLLLEAIRYRNPDLAMPPEKAGGKLPDPIIRDFETWIQQGAPDPREGTAQLVLTQQETWEKAKSWWAWKPPRTTSPPDVRDTAWPRADLDRFILSSLEAKNLHPVEDASKLALIRRVYFDLIGLPPTPEQTQSFLKDPSSNALASVVDQLLASPQFGERWGRHWLDVARYAESTGKDVNLPYPFAWRYRDYVIDAFNAGKPYDQFLKEQIAGDLLPASNNLQRAQQIVATGFLALGTKSINERNPRQFHLDLVDEQIDTLSQAVLGATIACARCHDHKFDPITQRDYYALAGIFTSTDTRYAAGPAPQNRRPNDPLTLPPHEKIPTLGMSRSPEEIKRKQDRLDQLQEERRQLNRDAIRDRASQANTNTPARRDDPQRNRDRRRINTEIDRIEAELRSFDDQGRELPLAMGVQDLPARQPAPPNRPRRRDLPPGPGRGPRPPEFASIGDCAFYTRGEADKPADKVPRGFPSLLTATPAPAIATHQSGRLQLAQWIVDPHHPLTSRVFVNRVWGWLFGQGLVPTPDNFGTSGSPPSHQALLDTLAVQFTQNGWSLKSLIRQIVLSRTYQLATTHNNACFEADPENALLWRMNKCRLDAEAIRDAMLSVSDQLNLTRPTGSPIARMMFNPGRPSALSESLVNAPNLHRSVYLPIARDLLPEALDVFDFAEPSLVTGTRDSTSVPAQALYLLNSQLVTQAARQFAARLRDLITSNTSESDAQGHRGRFIEAIRQAYWLAFSRPPSESELRTASGFFLTYPASPDKPTRNIRNRPPAASSDAWISFCRALLASAEFRYLN